MARCKYCNKFDSLIITEDARSHRGLCVSLTLQCTFCGQAFTSMSSNSTNGVYDINVRLAYGLRCIGKGSSAAKTFCAVMNLPQPPAKFLRYNGTLLESFSKVSDASMKKAVEETVQMNNSNRDITAAFDGSWQKRGLTSLNGVVSATSLETGKVLDFECLRKYCFVCKIKINKVHKCEKNFEGFSGGMESASYNVPVNVSVKYASYLSDGDSKAFNTVSEGKVYRND
ncbi:uncharacterized protein TNCV_2614491 [Trichonephila clavipes]|nr:uncharacterized protein TNCV_2614491 [Trichonephila clavipes]